MMPFSRMAYFSEEQFERMRDRVFELLETRGVRMDHDTALKALDKAGARVDMNSRMVRFPVPFLQEHVAQAPRAFTLAGREGKHPLPFPRKDGTFHTRTNTGAQSWIEPETGRYRRVIQDDIAVWARLVDRLEHIGFAAFPVPSDVPDATADIHALKSMLLNMEKHIWIQPYSGASIDPLIRLLIAAAGGEEGLRAHPPASFITCSLTPLEFKNMDLEVIVQCGRYGIPLQPCSLPSAGATGPITAPGVVVLAAAECLVMLVTSQVLSPGLPVIPTSLQFTTDMTTGRSLQSSVEALRQSALFVQFMKMGFDLPCHTYGSGSDAPDLDAQCMTERALQALLMALSGADVLGAAGQLEVATTISPLQLIIDDEVFGMVRGIISDMTLNDDSLAWADLKECRPGAQFLTHTHTFEHCRDALMPINFTRLNRETWENQGKKDLIEKAGDTFRNLMKEAGPLGLPQETVLEMERIVEGADKEIQS